MISPTANLNSWFDEKLKECLLIKMEEFREKESGWTLVEILNLVININKYVAFLAGTSTYVELPKYIGTKKAIINIQNNDYCLIIAYCFLWSIVAALYPAKENVTRTHSYPHFSDILKDDDIQFPISFDDINKFEKMNKLSINVYCEDRDEIGKKMKVVPIYLSREKSELPVIHLFAIEIIDDYADDDQDCFWKVDNNKKSIFHFTLIKNLLRLINTQVSRNEHRILMCDRCLCHFAKENFYDRHKMSCEKVNKCRLILPQKKQ